MKRRCTLGLTAAVSLLVASSVFAQGGYKVETIAAPTSPDLPKAAADALAPQGVRVTSGQGGVVAEVWLRKTMPLKPAAGESSDILYGALGEGAVVGVLHYPGPAADFRGQPLKPGYYVLRHALTPQDGAHMGAYPYRDALMLSPTGADTEINQDLKFPDLVKLGRLTSGTAHPAFLVMAPVSGETFPSVVKDDQGHWNLQLQVEGASGKLPVAITLVGKWEGA